MQSATHTSLWPEVDAPTPPNARGMRIPDFRLERYFARWEFSAPYLLSSSDAESFGTTELLAHADAETLALWNDMRLGYTESPGHPMLRAEIAALFPGLSPESVLVFSGAEEAIFAFMSVALGPGDHAVVTWPGYQSLYSAAGAAGAEVTQLQLRYAKRWKFDIDELVALLRPNTKAIVVNAPHNPTGMTLDRRTFAELSSLCERRGIFLFFDEVYRYGEYDEADRLPGAASSGATGVSLCALSKPFGLPGLRIGWIATPDADLIRRLAAFKDYLTICCSAPSEILGIIALRAKKPLLARNARIVQHNLRLLDDFFERRADAFEWVRPRAGLVAFPRMRSSTPIDEFAAKLVEAQGVMILPESVFDHTGNHFRIGFGRKNMPDVLARFEEFVDREH